MSGQKLNDYTVKIVEISGKPFAVMEQLERSARSGAQPWFRGSLNRGFIGSSRDGFLKASSLKLELGQRQQYCTLPRNQTYVIVSFIPGFRLSIVRGVTNVRDRLTGQLDRNGGRYQEDGELFKSTYRVRRRSTDLYPAIVSGA